MKRKKRTVPLMFLWTKRDQLRFIEAVERFQSLVNDLEKILAPRKRRAEAAAAVDAARKLTISS